ncbi:MAG: hypothetical protein ACYCYO_00080 [Bacilli bacterium]
MAKRTGRITSVRVTVVPHTDPEYAKRVMAKCLLDILNRALAIEKAQRELGLQET